MDFGLDKLVEMLEERFGRLAGTIVLAAIGIAAVAFAVHAVFQFFVLPVVKYAPDLLGAFNIVVRRMTMADAVHAGVQIIIGALAGIVGVAVYIAFSKRIHRRMRSVVLETQSIVEDCHDFTERNHAELHALSKKIKDEADTFFAVALQAATKILNDAEERAGLPKSAPLSLQSLQDTEKTKR